MAKPVRRKRRKAGEAENPLSRENFMIMGLGLLIIALGYLAMSEGSVEGFLPLVAAPILLVLGYCVVIPIGILYRRKRPATDKTS